MLYKIYKTMKIVKRALLLALKMLWNRTEMYCVLTGEISGANGALKYGASLGAATAIPITDVNVTIRGGVIDVTDSEVTNGWRKKIAGKFKEWSGDGNAIVDYNDTELTLNSEITLYIMADDTTGDEVYWSGTAVVTEIGISIPVEGEDKVMRHIAFEGTGALTKTDASAA